jgi:hypothetical protein
MKYEEGSTMKYSSSRTNSNGSKETTMNSYTIKRDNYWMKIMREFYKIR